MYTRSTFTSSLPDVAAGTTHFYRDQTSPTDPQCWGDGSYLGASGSFIQTGIANTDPRTPPAASLTGTRVTQFLVPAPDTSKIATLAADWASDVDVPLTVTVAPYPT